MTSRLKAVLALCLAAAAHAAAGEVPATRPAPAPGPATRPTVVYDATRYYVVDQAGRHRRPDTRPFGLAPAVLETWVGPRETETQAALRWAKEADFRRAILVLDFEPLPNLAGDRAAVEAYYDRVLEVVDAVRAKYPGLRIGHYGIPIDPTGDADGRGDGRGLLDALDFSVPELYLFPRQSHEQWVEMVERNLTAARRHDKPVLAMVNPTFTVPPYGDVPRERLVMMRDHLRGKVDGLILWGGSDDGNNDDVQDPGYRPLRYDPRAAWLTVFGKAPQRSAPAAASPPK